MPTYKVVNADQLDNDLQSIANKLKEKAGVTDALAFPDGFIEAADSIHDDTIDSLINRSITEIVNHKITTIGEHAFRGCSKLKKADFGNVTEIGGNAFGNCSSLDTLILRSDTVCSLAATSALSSTAISKGNGNIYVKTDLVDEYKIATNWSTYADQITEIVEV